MVYGSDGEPIARYEDGTKRKGRNEHSKTSKENTKKKSDSTKLGRYVATVLAGGKRYKAEHTPKVQVFIGIERPNRSENQTNIIKTVSTHKLTEAIAYSVGVVATLIVTTWAIISRYMRQLLKKSCSVLIVGLKWLELKLN